MAESKYAKYILKEPRGKGMPPRKPTQVPAITFNPDIVAGLSHLSSLNCNLNFMAVVSPHVIGDPPHKHDYDELLFFIASDPSIAPDLGGEVEIALGEDWEKHTITTSSILCLPAGVSHCPIYMKRVDKPFYFGHIMLASKYTSSANPDGVPGG